MDRPVGYEVDNLCYTTWFGSRKGEAVRVVAIDHDPTYKPDGARYTIQQFNEVDGQKRVATVSRTWLRLHAEG